MMVAFFLLPLHDGAFPKMLAIASWTCVSFLCRSYDGTVRCASFQIYLMELAGVIQVLRVFHPSVNFVKDQVLFPSEYRKFLGRNRSMGLPELVLLAQQAPLSSLVNFRTSNI